MDLEVQAQETFSNGRREAALAGLREHCRMRRIRPRFVGMRWWLGLAFAGVAALTAVAVVALLSRDSEHSFRRYGREFAVGNSVAAADALRSDASRAAVARQATEISKSRRVAVFVFGSDGRLISGPALAG